ncbi:glycosyltransferase involved in cell wall biosynthesis [Natronocella acetinitrilica]|uniref:Glycosyltransferase involved in cell wall biosynthesis n=1 Tax=Natronocella acetinitrilica TaxID=414046 RepID=A0AAE3G8V4_9GAMM|nr:glycosyltransferase [Natronocella acetinitrilica]MCP1677159.1 glycosyltransferase involved in cell wall biosynthesis [Natronocella acetinitrilica]
MKVLHLIDSGGLYGAEHMLLTLAQEQVKQGLKPTILSAGEPSETEKAIEIEARRIGLNVIVARMRPGLNVGEAKRILSWARSEGFDLLHSHGYKFNILLGVLPKRLRGTMPLATTLHGYVNAYFGSRMSLYEILDRQILRRLDGIVVVNERMRERLPKEVVRSSTCVHIPNGIASELPEVGVLPSDIRDFTQRHRIVFTAIGRLSQEKGLDQLIRVAAVRRNELESIGFVIIGEGPSRLSLEELTEQLGLKENFHFPGYLPNAGQLLPHFHALVMPSHTEGLPITILEALRAGVPMIASAVGGIPAVLDHVPSASLIRPGNLHDLGRELVNMASRRPGAIDVETGKALFHQHYTSRIMADRYCRLYDCMLSSKKGKVRSANEPVNSIQGRSE